MYNLIVVLELLLCASIPCDGLHCTSGSFVLLVSSATDVIIKSNFRSNCWAGQVAAFLQGIGYLTGPLNVVALDEQRVLECLCAHHSHVMEGLHPFPQMASASVSSTRSLFPLDA